MSEKSKKKEFQISKETAAAQVELLFEAFELDIDNKDLKDHLDKLTDYVQRGRVEILGSGDDIKIKQLLRKDCAGQKELNWNWSRLGLGKARIRWGTEGVTPFSQHYAVAAPMIGYETSDIMKMHPVDISILEDIASFFQKI